VREELLQSAGLTRCLYLALECPCEEDVRVAVNMDEPLGESYPCPVCQKACGFTILGVGGTKRPLPFWKASYKFFSSGEATALYWRLMKADKAARNAKEMVL